MKLAQALVLIFLDVLTSPQRGGQKDEPIGLAPVECRAIPLAKRLPPRCGEAFASDEHGRFAPRKRHDAYFETLPATLGDT
jgi:hypothetical protein